MLTDYIGLEFGNDSSSHSTDIVQTSSGRYSNLVSRLHGLLSFGIAIDGI